MRRVTRIASLLAATLSLSATVACDGGGDPAAAQGVAVAITPPAATVPFTRTLAFAAEVTGVAAAQSLAVTWSVQEAGGGTIVPGPNGTGVYTSPAVSGTYHVVATATVDGVTRGVATVEVIPPPPLAVSVTPSTAVVEVSRTLQLTAAVSGTATGQSTAVSWSVQEPAGGTISASGVYTAPATPGTYHVLATSVADPTKSDVAVVTVTPAAPAGGRWVMAYWSSWTWNWATQGVPRFDGSALTHVAVAHALTTAAGGMTYGYGLSQLANSNVDRPIPGTSVDLLRSQTIVSQIHSAGAKAVLMIGGSDDPNWLAATNATNRPTFVSTILAYVDAAGWDGVDLDWENGYGSGSPPSGYAQFAALAQELRAARPGLFIGVPLNNWGAGALATLLAPYADQLNVMTYDNNGDAGATWYHSALYGLASNGARGHSADAGIVPVLNAAGVQAAKVGIGVPFYAYRYGPATAPGQAAGGRAMIQYKTAVSTRLVNGLGYASYAFDAGTRTPAMFDAAGWIGYEDEASIREKASYAKAKGLGGAIVWLLDDSTFVTDTVRRNPLLDAMKREFLGRAPNKMPRVGTPTLSTFTAASGAAATITVSGLGRSVLWWESVPSSGFDLKAQTANAGWSHGVPTDYVVEASSDGGATWATLATVTGSSYITRTHVLDLTGRNRVRMRLTAAPLGGAGRVDLGLHDLRAGDDDYWLFLGDSNTSVVFDGTTNGDVGRFGYEVNQVDPTRWPIAVNGGVDAGIIDHYLRTRDDPFVSATGDGTGPLLYPDAQGNPRPLVRKWLDQFPGKYVSLAIGSNDINSYSWRLMTASDLDVMQAKMERLIKECLAAGKTVILPTLRWMTTQPYSPQNLAAWKDRLWNVILPKYPSVLRGPDVYAGSVDHPEWLQADGTHPNEAGRTVTRQQWTDWAVANVYTVP